MLLKRDLSDEKDRYRYAGQWKHGRMNGCGVYEINERIIYLHAGIAEVAAAKARMFINKPDGNEGPESVLINKEPEPDPEDPSQLIYTEDPFIIHTPTGRLINFVEDEENGDRLFWQPHLEDGGDIDPEKAEFLPLGFDEFYGRAAPGAKKESKLGTMITSLENKLMPLFNRLDNWVEEMKRTTEMNKKLTEKELEFIEAEICLEEALEDKENALKMKQKKEEKRAVTEMDSDRVSAEAGQDEADSEDEEEDGEAPTSFGTVDQGETDKDDDKPGKSSFPSLSMSLASYTPVSMGQTQTTTEYLAGVGLRMCGRCKSYSVLFVKVRDQVGR